MDDKQANGPADLYILSDLHLGEGRSPESLRYSRLEVFFYDQELSNLIDRIMVDSMAHRRRAQLILNGDVFDFLALIGMPTQADMRRERFRLVKSEHKLGLAPTAVKSAWKMARIIRGHPASFRALLRFIAGGYDVTILRGNHDVELFWEQVRERFYAELFELAGGGSERIEVSEEEIRRRVSFEDWFYYEPGRIYIEHGHQYEASNSFRYNLNPVLPSRYTDMGSPVLDYPTGSMFVRHIYNKVKLVDPYANYYVSLDQYLGLFSSANFLDMARTLTLHMPFFIRAIKNARLFELHGMEDIAAVHRERVRETAATKGVPSDRCEAIDGLIVEPVGKTKYSLVQEMLRPVARASLTISAITLLSLCGWFIVFTLIQSTGFLAEGIITKASLMAIFAVFSFFGLFVLFMWLNRRMRGGQKDPMTDICYDKAEAIAEIMDVPLVAMGHTHKADLRPFRRRKGTFGNSGTWIMSRGAWDAIKPMARQFTFLRVRDQDMELLRWDDAGRRWEPVALLEEYSPSPLELLLKEGDEPTE